MVRFWTSYNWQNEVKVISSIFTKHNRLPGSRLVRASRSW